MGKKKMEQIKTIFANDWAKLVPQNEAVLLAVSTGADSMALLWLVAHLPSKLRPKINIAYVDHQLRPESQAETRFIQEYCQEQGFPLYLTKWQKKPVTGLEAKARAFRYAFFAEILEKQNIKYLVTAHHADDQAETFLMKLIRGGELQQLTGIKAKRVFEKDKFLVRPLLSFSKAELSDFITKNKIPYFEDQTNQDLSYFRNRVRHKLMPKLKQENAKVLTHIADYEAQLTELYELVAAELPAKLKQLEKTEGYDVTSFQQLSLAWQHQVLRALFAKEKLAVTKQKLAQVQNALVGERPQVSLDLGAGREFCRSYQTFYFQKKSAVFEAKAIKTRLEVGKWHKLPHGQVGLFEKATFVFQEGDESLSVSKEQAPFYVRQRLSGDKMPYSQGTKKITRLLIDQKIPAKERAKLWYLVDDKDFVYWVFGIKKTDLSPRAVNAKIQYIIVYRRDDRREEKIDE